MSTYKLSAEERCLLLRSLWAKERELEAHLKLKIELDSPSDIIEDYKKELELVRNLDSKFIEWSI
jgi:hypothetical protein